MTESAWPPRQRLIPETAPFSEEQRDWLDGFFAGLLSGGVKDLGEKTEDSTELLADGDDGLAPWHDQCLSLSERMSLAEGRPLRRRLMAAMAQQDCGQCGYDCEEYANAIFLGTEKRTNLCAPGAKSTARMLNQLLAECAVTTDDAIGKPPESIRQEGAKVADLTQSSRDHPFEVIFHSRKPLNKEGSEKETWHIEFNISNSGLDYAAGDSFGIFPLNDPSLVMSVIKEIGASVDSPVGDGTLGEKLEKEFSLGMAPDRLFTLISMLVGGERRQRARRLALGDDPDGDADALDVLAALQKFPGVRPDPEAFIEALEPLQPRLYSIASSPKKSPNHIALAVDTVRYFVDDRRRLGVCSTFLAERVSFGDRVRAYVQKAHNFALPSDVTTPIIMVGPGTGVAPFRAFLYERAASGLSGPNWLFFGHQRRDFDFFYEEEFSDLQNSGVLTKLTLAWSRDGTEKLYVQHRMLEHSKELWRWLNEGAHIYVCGDAKYMAVDIEKAMTEIVKRESFRSSEAAMEFIDDLKRKNRYQTDIY